MNPKSILKSILQNEYETEDGDLFKAELIEGMSIEEIDSYKKTLPNEFLPSEIEELLLYCKGFEFIGLDEIRFDTFGQFGFEELFPNSIQLAGDGYGNFWILDIDTNGNWNSVYYVCHDPAVVIKHSENLCQFIQQIDEFGKKGSDSTLDIIHEKIVKNVWSEKIGIMQRNKRNYNFEKHNVELPEIFLVADLSTASIKTGFPWGKSGPNTRIIRPSDEPIWIIENIKKQGLFSKLFGRK